MVKHVTVDTETEERCFLYLPLLDVMSRRISECSAVEYSEVKRVVERMNELEGSCSSVL
jgi:hypothetical protein